MTITDTNNTPIHPGDTLEALETKRGTYKGDKFLVQSQKWDETDKQESLVAISQPSPFLTVLLTPERAKEYKVVHEQV